MRILLDECVNAGVRAAFPVHSVTTVSRAGWRSAKDGPLLLFAERSFDVFVTIDQRLERQNKLATFSGSYPEESSTRRRLVPAFERWNPADCVQHGLHAPMDRPQHGVVPNEAEPPVAR